jgi:hypothetical protein
MIEVENHSPFPHFLFEKTGYRGKPFDVLAIKATFRLKTDGSPADLEQKQSPLIMADVYWGNPETSSLKFETDLIIAKQRTDIHVIGHARTEHHQPCRKWRIGVRIGEWVKQLYVTGPRWWMYEDNQWQLSEPDPIKSIPLRYELAFGGTYQPKTENPEAVAYPQNPIGIGFWDFSQLSTELIYPASQFESFNPAKAISNMQQHYAPEGFGPLPRWWQPRVNYAGTYDDAWQKQGFPFLPDDFDFAFYNSAPPDQQINGYLKGDESLFLLGMLPEANVIKTALAGYLPVCVVEDETNYIHKLLPRLSTVTIDLNARLIYQTWHLTLPRDFAAQYIVLGTIVPPPAGCGNSPSKDGSHG